MNKISVWYDWQMEYWIICGALKQYCIPHGVMNFENREQAARFMESKPDGLIAFDLSKEIFVLNGLRGICDGRNS